MPRSRSPNLDGGRVEAIVRIIGRLPGKPCWEDVVEAVRVQLGASYTRQALHRHAAIGLALRSRRHGVPAKPGIRPLSARAAAAAAETARLREERSSALTQVTALLEKHVVWAYNAYAHGMTEEDLNRALPRIERT